MINSILDTDLTPLINYSGSLHFSTGEPFFKAMHNHPECTEVLLICEGEGMYNIGGKTYEVKPQSIVIYNQGVWHEEKSNPSIPHKMLYLGFSNFRIKGLPPGHLIKEDCSPVIPTRNFLMLEEMFKALVKENNTKEHESYWISNHLVAVILGLVVRTIGNSSKNSTKNSDSFKIVSEVKHYIQENYHRDITLKDLAQYCYINQFYLSHLFKKETNISPIQYLIKYRIQVSKHILSTTNKTIAEISQMVGYQSETHFQNVFKKITGITPGEFRRIYEPVIDL